MAAETEAHKKSENAAWFSSFFLYRSQSGVMLSRFFGSDGVFVLV